MSLRVICIHLTDLYIYIYIYIYIWVCVSLYVPLPSYQLYNIEITL